MRYNIKKHTTDEWELWENATGPYAATVSGNGFPERLVCYLTSDEILEIFNQIVPRTVEEPYMIGDPDCKHSWRPWDFNTDFMRCSKCPAMQKVKHLVPREYK